MKRNDLSADTSEENTRHELAWVRRERTEGQLLLAVAHRLERKRTRRIATGASLLAVALIGLRFLGPRGIQPSATDATTPVVTNATVARPAFHTLPDRSTVTLKDDARIRVDYRADVRRVTLVSGEAHFQVARDNDRPFIVRAGGVDVRAEGTAFLVQLATQAVEVLVTEGSVRVSPQTTPGSEVRAALSTKTSATLVEAGRRCVVATGMVPQVHEVSAADADERLAWRIPQLEFSRTPLPEIVALLNRHAVVTQSPALQIADPELNQIKLTGVLRADNSEGLLRLLESNFKVTAERSGNSLILRKLPTDGNP